MRYWGVLGIKLLVAWAFLYAIWSGIYAFYPVPPAFAYNRQEMFLHDLPWTTLMFAYNLLCNGVLVLIVLDQRYRCRTCGRRLRMPVTSGSHAHVILGPPRTDYICIYGHGTLKVPELQISGREKAAWKSNEDMWTELFAHTPDRDSDER
jgi:hypothetical protein